MKFGPAGPDADDRKKELDDAGDETSETGHRKDRHQRKCSVIGPVEFRHPADNLLHFLRSPSDVDFHSFFSHLTGGAEALAVSRAEGTSRISSLVFSFIISLAVAGSPSSANAAAMHIRSHLSMNFFILCPPFWAFAPD
jgi:hypothetical protein